MEQRDLAELFESFRREGNAEALGEVFDRTAPDLRRIARRLAPSRDDADDLVQATYLTAIQKARLLQPGRAPMPWLVSILTLHAHAARRARRRQEAPIEIQRDEVEPPDLELERAEFEGRVRQAIDALPERYAAVVAPHVFDGSPSASVASRLGRRPGTVRTQLQRGLELLRHALSRATLPLGAWIDARELGALRGRVLSRALAERGGAAAPTATAMSAMPKLALLATLAALLTAGAWWRLRPSDLATPANVRAGLVSTGPLGGASSPAPSLPGPLRTSVEPSRTVWEVVATAPTDVGGVRGRLRRSDSIPAAGVEIRLAAIGAELLERSEFLAPWSSVELERSRCTTGPAGEFVLPGGRPGELLVLAIDCGGPLGCLRLVDGQPDEAGAFELGDLVLPATSPVGGRVVDEAGQPIAGARVRALPDVPGLDPSADAFAMPRGGTWAVAALPQPIRALLDELPTPTVAADLDGRFSLPVPAGQARIQVDAPGRVVRTIEAVGAGAALGEVVLSAGRTVRGRVLDAEGAPVSDAEVLVGVLAEGGSPVLRACPPTDLEGRFARAGVPSHGRILIAVRPGPGLSWVTLDAEGNGVLELRLPPPAQLELALRSDAGDELEDVELELHPNVVGGMLQPPVLREAPRTARMRHGERLGGLTPGSYALIARQPGHAVSRASLELSAGPNASAVTLDRALLHEVVVLDADSGEALVGAEIEALHSATRARVARARSGNDGLATLAIASTQPLSELELEARHGEHAPARRVPLRGSEGSQPIELLRGGALDVRILDGGAPPARRLTLMLEGPGEQRFTRHFSTDASGALAVGRLAPKFWRYRLFEAWSASDGWAVARQIDQPGEELRSGAITIADGAVTTLVIELDPAHSGGAAGRARLRGVFSLRGLEPARLLVRANYQGEPFRTHEAGLDATGRFDFGWLPAGEYYVDASFRRGSLAEIGARPWSMRATLSPGQILDVEAALQSTRIDVRVRDEGGGPVPDAEFWLESASGQRIPSFTLRADADGRGELVVHSVGEFAVAAEHPTLGWAKTSVTVPEFATSLAVEATLRRGVLCSGTIKVPPALLVPAAQGFEPIALVFREQGASPAPYRVVRVVPDEHGEAAFTLSGLRAGAYRVHAGPAGPRGAVPLELSIGPADALGVVLVFDLQAD